ncbi:MAG: hypothetical protein FWC77_03955 [Defluviitaleaceae bacterium]|nr:hypothetical protein [Defluviitaleaceae bacterium]
MDENNIPINTAEDSANGLSAIPEETSPNSGLQNRYCRKSILMLSAVAVACVVLAVSPVSPADALPFIMAFPFWQIGRGLRALSLSGGVGNIVAIVLYGAFCLLPVLGWLLIRKKRIEDALLPVISIALFVVMYYMINPGIRHASALSIPLEQALLGGIIYSLLMAYGVTRVIRLFENAAIRSLGRYAGSMLHILNTVFVFIAFGLIVAQMLDAFEALRAGNTAPEQQLSVTYVILALQYITHALPYVLNIWVILAVQILLKAFNTDPYSLETVTAAKEVSRVCVTALTASVLAIPGINLLQLMFISQLHVVNSNVNFPVVPILFVLGALLLTRYIAENKLLKDENDRFV